MIDGYCTIFRVAAARMAIPVKFLLVAEHENDPFYDMSPNCWSARFHTQGSVVNDAQGLLGYTAKAITDHDDEKCYVSCENKSKNNLNLKDQRVYCLGLKMDNASLLLTRRCQDLARFVAAVEGEGSHTYMFCKRLQLGADRQSNIVYKRKKRKKVLRLYVRHDARSGFEVPNQ